MTDNVLAKLREKRARAIVPIREDILVPKSEVIPPDLILIAAEVSAVEVVEKSSPHTISSIESLEEELEQAPETVRHSGIILDKGVDDGLSRFCKDNKITIETFLEAAWCLSELDPKIRGQILEDAKKRYTLRKQMGSKRRLLTSLKKLKS